MISVESNTSIYSSLLTSLILLSLLYVEGDTYDVVVLVTALATEENDTYLFDNLEGNDDDDDEYT